jgi:hypothetical protein
VHCAITVRATCLRASPFFSLRPLGQYSMLFLPNAPRRLREVACIFFIDVCRNRHVFAFLAMQTSIEWLLYNDAFRKHSAGAVDNIYPENSAYWCHFFEEAQQNRGSTLRNPHILREMTPISDLHFYFTKGTIQGRKLMERMREFPCD